MDTTGSGNMVCGINIVGCIRSGILFTPLEKVILAKTGSSLMLQGITLPTVDEFTPSFDDTHLYLVFLAFFIRF